MPVVEKDVKTLILLYQRCKEWNQLPAKGSIMDQPERIMDLFDEITRTVNIFKEKQEEDRMSELRKDRLAGGLGFRG
jgi:hypothetical protein